MKILFLFVLILVLPKPSFAVADCDFLLQNSTDIRIRNTVSADLPGLDEILDQNEVQIMMNRRSKPGLATRVFSKILADGRLGIVRTIVQGSNDEPIGFLSIYPIHRQTHTGVIGYSLSSHFWNRHYLSRTLEHLVREAFESEGLRFLVAEVAVSNKGSQRVLEKAGFKRVSRIKDTNPEVAFRAEDLYIYRLQRRDAYLFPYSLFDD